MGRWHVERVGAGKMSKVEDIYKEIELLLSPGPLTGRTALVTSGPTIEPIDPVRFISNRSSGKQGHAIAERLSKLGADTHLISGPVNIPYPDNVRVTEVRTAEEMLNACQESMPVDISIFAAAVSDYKINQTSDTKIKKIGENISLELTENPDILKRIGKRNSQRPELVIGFAAETENLHKNAEAKLVSKGCDWILANDVSNGKVFGEDENEIVFISKNKSETWNKMTKENVAKKLSSSISDYFSV